MNCSTVYSEAEAGDPAAKPGIPRFAGDDRRDAGADHFFSVSTYSVSMTSSSLPAPDDPVGPPAPGPPPEDDAALRYITSAILCDACWRRSPAEFILSVPPASSA